MKSQWKPIETAPKDGTLIDVWTTGACRIPDVKWHGERWCHWGLDDFDGMAWVTFLYQPTHWMPIPIGPPPQEKGGEA